METLKKYYRPFWKFFLIIVPVILLLLPVDFFDKGETVCLSQTFFSMECPGCGMTRAFMHFMHGEIETAIDFNVFVIIVFPLVFILWVKEVAYYFFNKHILKFL